MPLHEQRDEVADAAALEACVLFVDEPRYRVDGDAGIGPGEPDGNLLEDLLFTQRDHSVIVRLVRLIGQAAAT